MKKIIILLLCIFIISGCNEKNIVDENYEDEIKYQKIAWNCEVDISDIKTIKDNGMMDIQPRMFITKDNKLYEFSVDKKYSNEQNCKKVETDVLFDKFYLYPNDRDLSYAVDINGKWYYMSNERDLTYYRDIFSVPYIDNKLESIYSEHPNNYGQYVGGAEAFYVIYYVKDNNIYKMTLKTSGEFVSDEFYEEFPNNENFISLEGKVFKTDKAYYKIDINNSEKCMEYEDIECTYGLVKIENISNEYNNIYYFNGNYIIYNNDENIYIYNPYI